MFHVPNWIQISRIQGSSLGKHSVSIFYSRKYYRCDTEKVCRLVLEPVAGTH